MSHPDPKDLWQGQTTEYDPMTLADIHTKAAAFQARIRRRNRTEYVGCALAIAGFAPALFFQDSWMMQVGAALTIMAVLFVGWQLHRRASAEPTPGAGAAAVDFHRQQLVRQQQAVRSIAGWYLAPM